MLRAGLLKTSLTNYPGRLAAAVFLPGCNLRCPYCYNRELALSDPAEGPAADSDEEYFSEADIFAHLEKRASVLGALAVSGGEPLLSPFLEPLIRKAKSLHLAVKIDTNGTLPDRLYRLLENEALRPDMVAMDIKTSPQKYSLLAPGGGDTAGRQVIRSIGVLRGFTEKNLCATEYRTVLVPGLTDLADIREIAALLPENADWKLAVFSPGRCLNPAWNGKQPFTREETDRMVAAAQEKIPAAVLR